MNEHRNHAVLRIGELAARSGVAASALRFYEERGLIQSERNSAGHRRYARELLVERLGPRPLRLRNELERLALWSGSGGIFRSCR